MSTSVSRMSRMFRRSNSLVAVAALAIGSLMVAGPARSAPAVEMGTVSYTGKVSCEFRYPTPAKSVPVKVKLSSGGGRTAEDVVDNDGLRTADYGPVDLNAPLDSKFQLRVTVTCKAPGKAATTFNRQFGQNDLTDEQPVTLDIK
ncbi:hypothetical protein [Streptomyces sp. NPDC090445]|uniref:hypothetical protein n=1 Tax=Streptomyces sp. NPDC090445 TaxID=3365963 RepID=UPI00382FFB62